MDFLTPLGGKEKNIRIHRRKDVQDDWTDLLDKDHPEFELVEPKNMSLRRKILRRVGRLLKPNISTGRIKRGLEDLTVEQNNDAEFRAYMKIPKIAPTNLEKSGRFPLLSSIAVSPQPGEKLPISYASPNTKIPTFQN